MVKMCIFEKVFGFFKRFGYAKLIDIKLVVVNSRVAIMTYSRVYVGVIMLAADFGPRFIHPACCRFSLGKLIFFTCFVLVLPCAVFKISSTRLLNTLKCTASLESEAGRSCRVHFSHF